MNIINLNKIDLSFNIKDGSVTTEKITDGAITEPKLDTNLQAKVNNNVKTVEQTLTNTEIDIASKNLKFRDANGNFFADIKSYDEVAKLSIVPKFSMFGNNCHSNTFGEYCSYNTFGHYCNSNTFGTDCSDNIFGNNCSHNIFGNFLQYAKIDNEVIYIELKSNTNSKSPLKNIHILSGVKGKSNAERLVINIPDEYLNSSRELIITTKRTDGGPSTPEDLVMYYADEVVDKQNKQDNTLATTSKEVVGAINELFNGGVKDKSIVSDKIADYSITMSKLNRAGSNVPDLGLSAMHNLDITLTGEGKTGSATLQSNGVTYDQSNNIVYAIDSIIRSLGSGVTLIITEPVAGSSFGTEYVGTVTGVTIHSSTELSAIVKNLTDNKDYFVVVNLSNYEFITKISLTDQLPKIASLDSKVGMNVKVLPKGTDLLSDNIEEGIYTLLVGSDNYKNFPYGKGLSSGRASILVKVSSQYFLLGIDNGSSDEFPIILVRNNGNDYWYGNSIANKFFNKLDNTSILSDTEINTIWDNN